MERTPETRLSVVSIIVEDPSAVQAINALLHHYGHYIVGRLGLPYREKELSIICVVLDAPPAETSALSGKLGMLPGVSAKTVTAKAGTKPIPLP